MLPSRKTIIKNLDEEIPQAIRKISEIQSCICMFHFLQDLKLNTMEGWK